MNKALGEIPVTVKLRTGVKEGRNTAHKLMPRLSSEWGVGCITARKILSPFLLLDEAVRVAARPYTTATLHEACRLGLHQGVRGCRSGV